ncbi:MAG: hypothetical protein OHK0050_06540 [Roseiflexaceae bacterium]
MNQVESKYERMDAIERLLARTPAGMTTSELARALAVDPSTIYRNLQMLESRGTGLIKEGHRYILDHRRSLYTVKLTQHELVALYIAMRLLSRHSDEHNPHVIRAMEKLADALTHHAPLIAHHIVQAADAVRHRRIRPGYVDALEIVTQGWVEGRLVWMAYRDAQNSRLFLTIRFRVPQQV